MFVHFRNENDVFVSFTDVSKIFTETFLIFKW